VQKKYFAKMSFVYFDLIYIIKELVPGKSRSKKEKSTTATFWEGIF
jgi:hypothetical protein